MKIMVISCLLLSRDRRMRKGTFLTVSCSGELQMTKSRLRSDPVVYMVLQCRFGSSKFEIV
jgi:hypothetical protein